MVEGTDTPTENAEISAINIPNKTRLNIKSNSIFFHMQVMSL